MVIRVPRQNGFDDIKKETITKMSKFSVAVTSTQSADEIFEDNAREYNTVTTTTNFLQDDSLKFILVPLAVLLGIITLSALVYLMARQRRCTKRTGIHFDDYRNQKAHNYRRLVVGEEFDEIDDDPTECLLNGKLQINNRYDNYQAAQVIRIGKALEKVHI